MNEVVEINNFIKQCLKLKPHDVIKILEDYRTLGDIPMALEDKSILISMKIPESLLTEFRTACKKKGLKYQTQIKILMKEWLISN